MITDLPGPPEPPRSAGRGRRRSPAGRRFWRAAVRSAGVVVVVASVCTALVGAAVAPWEVTVLIAPATGTWVGGVVALMHPAFPGSPSARRAAVYAAAAGVLLVPFVAGLSALGTAGGALFLALLILGSLVVGDRLARLAGADQAQGETVLEDVIPLLPTVCLLEEWHLTEALLDSAEHHGSAVQVRALLLDELTRRDPAGVHDWLISRDRSPESYIRPDRDLAG